MKQMTMLVPLDGSPLAEAALTKAMDLAEGVENLKVILLRAAEAHTFPGADPTDAQVKVVREAEEYLSAVADRVRQEGIKDVEPVVWYGSPAYSIVEGARLYNAGLIVMSTHGRSGFGRLILGSVAESVLRGTTTPILLVRRPEAPVQVPEGEGGTIEERGSEAAELTSKSCCSGCS